MNTRVEGADFEAVVPPDGFAQRPQPQPSNPKNGDLLGMGQWTLAIGAGQGLLEGGMG